MRAVILAIAALLAFPGPRAGGTPAVPAAAFTWTMVPRFVENVVLRGAPHVPVLNITPSHAQIHDERRAVLLDACASGPAIVTYTWRIDTFPSIDRGGDCSFRHTFHTLGRHRVALQVADAAGRRAGVTQMLELRDLLIVSLGDSYASGEGVPDVPGRYELDWDNCLDPRRPCIKVRAVREAWTHERCHRSSRAGPALAGRMLEQDPHSTVTFISLACSGAEIEQGLLRHGHRGQRAQVEELVRLLCPPATTCSSPEQRRSIDVLMLTVGGNDIGFSFVVTGCVIEFDRCTERGLPIQQCLQAVERRLQTLAPDQQWLLRRACNEQPGRVAQRLIAELPPKYRRLNAAIRAKLTFTPGGAIWITEYPDPTFAPDGRICGFGDFPLDKGVRTTDVAWLFENVLTPLNGTIRSSARELGWGHVGEIARRYRGHGYCSPESWFVTYRESWRVQGDLLGTLHPNGRGHQAIGQRIAEVVGPRLFGR